MNKERAEPTSTARAPTAKEKGLHTDAGEEDRLETHAPEPDAVGEKSQEGQAENEEENEDDEQGCHDQ